MTARRPTPAVRLGFEETSVRVPLEAIIPLREVSSQVRKSVKYGQNY